MAPSTLRAMQTLTLPSGNTITYGYSDGKVTSLTLNGTTPILSEVLYQPFGLAQGDLAGARAVMRAALATVESAALVAYFANYWDLFWVLDEAQQQQ